MKKNPINNVYKLGFPWITQDPFLFCVYHQDNYPKGNDQFGPAVSLSGRNLGNDFIKKDGWRMYHGETVPGFPAHPHRGFETVTFVLKGIVDHADSNGAAGRYGNRDVQWMTAGSGLQHSEMFPLLNKEKENPLELFQIWLNLPAKNKFVKPFYKMLWNDTVPQIEIKDINGKKTIIDIVAGKVSDIAAPSPAPDSWASEPSNEVSILHFMMEENAIFEISGVSAKTNRSLYFFEGTSVKINDFVFESENALELDASEKIVIQNGGKPGRFLLLQGKPIGEPVVQYGPFVMNSKEEIQQAFLDYQKTRFGGWPWKKSDQVHDKTRGRFALYDTGEEIIKD